MFSFKLNNKKYSDKNCDLYSISCNIRYSITCNKVQFCQTTDKKQVVYLSKLHVYQYTDLRQTLKSAMEAVLMICLLWSTTCAIKSKPTSAMQLSQIPLTQAPITTFKSDMRILFIVLLKKKTFKERRLNRQDSYCQHHHRRLRRRRQCYILRNSLGKFYKIVLYLLLAPVFLLSAKPITEKHRYILW